MAKLGLDWWQGMDKIGRERQRWGKVQDSITRANWVVRRNRDLGGKRNDMGRNIRFRDGRWRRHLWERMIEYRYGWVYYQCRFMYTIRLPRSVPEQIQKEASSIFTRWKHALFIGIRWVSIKKITPLGSNQMLMISMVMKEYLPPSHKPIQEQPRLWDDDATADPEMLLAFCPLTRQKLHWKLQNFQFRRYRSIQCTRLQSLCNHVSLASGYRENSKMKAQVFWLAEEAKEKGCQKEQP